jgi:hypothetical protein
MSTSSRFGAHGHDQADLMAISDVLKPLPETGFLRQTSNAVSYDQGWSGSVAPKSTEQSIKPVDSHR